MGTSSIPQSDKEGKETKCEEIPYCYIVERKKRNMFLPSFFLKKTPLLLALGGGAVSRGCVEACDNPK